MNRAGSTWAIVLAAGEGSRLSSMTVGDDGVHVPKQFCSLFGDRTLLDDTIARARELGIPPRRIVTIVARQHRRFWCTTSASAGGSDGDPGLVVQPLNRGTAAGILLPLLTVLEHDPDAVVLVFPSDHWVEKIGPLRRALGNARAALGPDPNAVTLLGVAPDADESDYGWIVPEPGSGPVRRVLRFVEKPSHVHAAELRAQGALWNSFVLVARGKALLDLIARRLPWISNLFARAFEVRMRDRQHVIECLYENIESYDFSRHVLQHAIDWLRVVEVPPCGWTDVGTEERVLACIRRRRMGASSRTAGVPAPFLVLGRDATGAAMRHGGLSSA